MEGGGAHKTSNSNKTIYFFNVSSHYGGLLQTEKEKASRDKKK